MSTVRLSGVEAFLKTQMNFNEKTAFINIAAMFYGRNSIPRVPDYESGGLLYTSNNFDNFSFFNIN